MLSILIPVFDYDVTSLVKELHKQATVCGIDFEILIFDDGSDSQYNKENYKLNDIDNCTFKAFPNNIGRSAIRNLLGSNAQFNNLIFIDAGTYPKQADYILKYITLKNSDVIFGGMCALETNVKKPYKLRWKYTKFRESQRGIHSSNFAIKKNIFSKHPFDHTLKGYGYEDVLFFEILKTNGINIKVINNPVIHHADDDSDTFIKKNENALKNLITLIEKGKLDKNIIGISKFYYKAKRMNLNRLIAYGFNLLKPVIKSNLRSNYPSLFLYDMYRLGYFCKLKNEK